MSCSNQDEKPLLIDESIPDSTIESPIIEDTNVVHVASTIDSVELRFKESLFAILEVMSSGDVNQLQHYVHKDLGLIITYRPGVYDAITTITDFENTNLRHYMWYDSLNVNGIRINYEALPIYDCHLESFDKYGLYATDKGQQNQLSALMIALEAYELTTYTDEEINHVLELENQSRAILFAGVNGHASFSLTEIDGSWYLTIIDTVTGDCSA